MRQRSNILLVESEIPTAAATPDEADASPREIEPELRALPSGLPRPADEGRPERVELPAPEAKAHRRRRFLLIGAGLLALAAAADFSWHYWTVGRFQVSTDDAYVKADNTTIAPKVSGYLSAVLVGDNEQVKAGQVLARIDDRDFRVALDQTKADVAAAQAAIANKRASLAAQQSVIDTARATVSVDEANLTFAEQENERYSRLATTGYGSVQNAQQAVSRLGAARAAFARDTAALATAARQIDVLKAELAQAQATLAHDEAVQGRSCV